MNPSSLSEHSALHVAAFSDVPDPPGSDTSSASSSLQIFFQTRHCQCADKSITYRRQVYRIWHTAQKIPFRASARESFWPVAGVDANSLVASLARIRIYLLDAGWVMLIACFCSLFRLVFTMKRFFI